MQVAGRGTRPGDLGSCRLLRELDPDPLDGPRADPDLSSRGACGAGDRLAQGLDLAVAEQRTGVGDDEVARRPGAVQLVRAEGVGQDALPVEGLGQDRDGRAARMHGESQVVYEDRFGRLAVSPRQGDAKEPLWSSTFDDYMVGLQHVIKVAGPDHVCFGADWDGGGGIAGMQDVTALPAITARLRTAGYGDIDLAKMLGGNVLRIVRTAEAWRTR